MPQNSWNIAKVDVKYQSISQLIYIYKKICNIPLWVCHRISTIDHWHVPLYIFATCFKPETGFLTSYAVVLFCVQCFEVRDGCLFCVQCFEMRDGCLFCVQCFEVRDSCLFCCYWWPSLFKLSFHNDYDNRNGSRFMGFIGIFVNFLWLPKLNGGGNPGLT